MRVDTTALVATDWLAENLSNPDIRVVDGSFKMPGVLPSTSEDHAHAHIPNAVFFDIDAVADHATGLPHMLPGPVKFSSAMGRLGLSEAHHIVVYDTAGIIGAARVWWTLRVFGQQRVSVLDGGLRKWRAEGRATEGGPVTPVECSYESQPNLLLVRDCHQIVANQKTRLEQIVDARAAGRFSGEAPEPRAGLRSGHIPGSLNVDYASLIDPDSGTMQPAEVIRARFWEAGVDLTRPIVTSCGSGVTACVLALGLHIIGGPDVAVYDGSWAEWGQPGIPKGHDVPLPVETGMQKS